jgi:putative DNA-invertase from lambdoid prophage Rac
MNVPAQAIELETMTGHFAFHSAQASQPVEVEDQARPSAWATARKPVGDPFPVRCSVKVLLELYTAAWTAYSITQVYTFTTRRAMAVYGYTRVSTERQANEGESLGAQKRTIEGYAMMLGLTVAETFVEKGISGSMPFGERPQGTKLLAGLKPADVVITPKLDRMFRSARDALDVLDKLKGRGISLHMIDLGGDVTGNGVSKLVFTILSAVAEAERDRTRERIQEVKKDQRDRGRYLGGTTPFGYRLAEGGELIEDPDQQEAIKRIRRLRRSGKSLRAVADLMAKQGFKISHVAVKKLAGEG